ncbi:Threonine synthase [Arsenophonus endosymbiont of Bemisia tabaci Q2]|nr:Threonine synthase [Arsenophonus endosymbiont of Bemisia tabaci Q2]
MKLYNLKNQSEQVRFLQAVKQGLGSAARPFFPLNIPKLNDEQLAKWLQCDFITRSRAIFYQLILAMKCR